MSIIDGILNRVGVYSTKQFQEKVKETVKIELDNALPKWLGETADDYKWLMPGTQMFANQADLY